MNTDDLLNIVRPIDPDRGFRFEPQLPEEEVPLARDGEFAEIIPFEDVPLTTEAIVIANHMDRITAKLNIEMRRLESAGLAIAQAVNGITPTDQASYTELCEALGDNKIFLEKAESFIEPWKQLFYRPYQSVLERSRIINQAPMQSHKSGKERIMAYDRAVKAAWEAETMRLQKEQRDREETQRLENAIKAEELGLSPSAVETILTQPSTAPSPVALPFITRPSGFRKIAPNWGAELVDKDVFWKWARQQKEMPAMLVIDQPTMNREAKTHRATLEQRYPGFKGINKGGCD